MDTKLHHPILYALNARVQLTEIASTIGRPLTLNEFPEEALDRLRTLGIDFVWPIGVWRTGRLSRYVARHHEDLLSEYKLALPDCSTDDILGSPYAIAEYAIDPSIGGEDALLWFRDKLSQRGIGLILDFVVNHTGLDHHWIHEHPNYYIQGSNEELDKSPDYFFRATTRMGSTVIAHGRDPYFPPWTDTAQLNLSNRHVQHALTTELLKISEYCDGVRCDMAMLAAPSTIQRTWGTRPLDSLSEPPAQGDFWQVAINEVRKNNPEFLFIAEAYWDSESALRALGFDYTYDKTLYDRLIHKNGGDVRAHLIADPKWQARTIRFLENHDEERVARTLSFNRHMAAAVLVATLPGMLLLHDGQLEGRKVKLPVQLRRRCKEPVDTEIRLFYERLFEALEKSAIRRGNWALLPVYPAWRDNSTWKDFIAYTWRTKKSATKLIVVNYASHQGQCYIGLPEKELGGKQIVLKDLLGPERYVRSGDEVKVKGIYFDMPAYGFHVFDVGLRRINSD